MPEGCCFCSNIGNKPCVRKLILKGQIKGVHCSIVVWRSHPARRVIVMEIASAERVTSLSGLAVPFISEASERGSWQQGSHELPSFGMPASALFGKGLASYLLQGCSVYFSGLCAGQVGTTMKCFGRMWVQGVATACWSTGCSLTSTSTSPSWAWGQAVMAKAVPSTGRSRASITSSQAAL